MPISITLQAFHRSSGVGRVRQGELRTVLVHDRERADAETVRCGAGSHPARPSGNQVVSFGKCRRRSPGIEQRDAGVPPARRRLAADVVTSIATMSAVRNASASRSHLGEAILRDQHDPVAGTDLRRQGLEQSLERLSAPERRDDESEIHNAPILYDGVAASRTDRILPLRASTDTIELSIVMPCLNEAETLDICVARRGAPRGSGVGGEVIVADNGSTDGSQEIARAPAHASSTSRARATARAAGRHRGGARRYVIMGDADDSYDFAKLDPFVDRLRAGDDLVMGNRFKGGIEPGAMPSLHRYLGNPVLS